MNNICDASVLVALALPEDSQHAKAREWLATFKEPLAVPNAVLVETANALWDTTHDAAFLAVWATKLATEMDIVIENQTLIQNALERYGKDFKKFSLVDCQLIEWAKSEGATVLTFDAEIQRELRRS